LGDGYSLREIDPYPRYLLSHPATAFSSGFRVCKTSGIVSARKLPWIRGTQKVRAGLA